MPQREQTPQREHQFGREQQSQREQDSPRQQQSPREEMSETGRKFGAEQRSAAEEHSVPAFASYEELAHVPSRPFWFFRRGPLQRLFWFVLAIVVIKILSSEFLGKYGVYVVAIVGVAALIVILWGFFRRDPAENVGIKLQ